MGVGTVFTVIFVVGMIPVRIGHVGIRIRKDSFSGQHFLIGSHTNLNSPEYPRELITPPTGDIIHACRDVSRC